MVAQGPPQQQGEPLPCLLQEAALEAPEVHGHQRLSGEVVPVLAVVGGEAAALPFPLDVLLLHDALQQAVPVDPAHAPGHAAVVAEGLAQVVAHHGVLEAVGAVGVVGQVVVEHPVGLGAVVVVGVDNREGAVYQFPGRQHRVGGAPGLGPAGGNGHVAHHVLHFLEGVADLHPPADPAAHQGAEVGLQLPVDDKNNLLKPGPPGVIDGIVDEALPTAAYAVHLLQAAVSAAHAGSQNDQNRFFHRVVSSICM